MNRLLLALTLVLCTTAPTWAAKKRVVTTFTIIADIASNVAGDAAVVESITKPGAEIHDYQPTPLDIVKAQAADLVLWNGLNLERWFERFFGSLRGVPGVVLSEGVEPPKSAFPRLADAAFFWDWMYPGDYISIHF